MELINIGITDVILQDYEDGQGKIIISNLDHDYNFSYYWGAMGNNTNLKKFIKEVDSDYFANKLVGHLPQDIDVKATFANLRREIKDFMPWYKHVEFQKEMRYEIRKYQQSVYSQESFVHLWDSFKSSLCPHFHIDSRSDALEVDAFFEGYCEHWNLIVTKPPKAYNWCVDLHKKLKKQL